MSLPKVAIACQGGGSHAAFACGVLRRLFEREFRERFELVALSGTSGGAMCAAISWGGLIRGGPDEAIKRLAGFWEDLKAKDAFDFAANFWAQWFARLPVTAEISPHLYLPMAEPQLRRLVERHLALEELSVEARGAGPKLLIGATDILSGDRLVFGGEELTTDQLIASAAVPPLFRAVPVTTPKQHHLCWDGLFTTNPPIREFTKLPERPNEIWVIQINPQRREGEPRSMQAISDRRNELAGNLSLASELHFVDVINRLVKEKKLVDSYQEIELHVVEMDVPGLDLASKLDRSGILIDRLIEAGMTQAPEFLSEKSKWPRGDSLPKDPVDHAGLRDKAAEQAALPITTTPFKSRVLVSGGDAA